MDSKTISKVRKLLEHKCCSMVSEHFQIDVNFKGDFPQNGFHYMFFRRGMMMTDTDVRFAAFSRAWEEYAGRLSQGTGPFIVVQDPWKRHREIPVSAEIAMKVLVLGGFS